MTNEIKVSVLTPIYNHNTEYVRQCLESLKNQTMQESEFILIDNGAIQEAKNLITEYEHSDSRFKVIHIKKNNGVGRALNKGLEIARGQYIGIVESDDFIEPDMYDKLYNKITNYNSDVCITGFYTYNNGTSTPYNLLVNSIFDNINETHIFSVFDYPFLFTCHQSMWAKLYKSEFIKSIKFYENGTYVDAQFMTEVFCRTRNIIGLKEHLYHYRIDNQNASNSNAKKDASLMNIIDDWEDCKKIIYKYNLYDQLKEEMYYQASKAGYRFYKNIDMKYKKQFFNKWKHFTKELKNDKNFSFKYFNPEQKRFIECVLNNNYKATLNLNNTNDKLLEKIFSVKNHPDKKHKVVQILGIKIKLKRKIKPLPQYAIENTIRNLYYLQKSNIQAAAIHPTTFSKYKNIYNGQKIVVAGCGPTLKYYNQDKELVHIGVNRTFLNNNIEFNYLFIQDRLENDMDKANSYLPDKCIKFYGILPELRYSQVKKEIDKISNQDICNANAEIYIIEDSVRKNWANNLCIEPIGDWCGCVFSALQFALYTNPKTIYIVGCDCSAEGHFYKEFTTKFVSKNTTDLSYQKKSWNSFKQFVNTMYPNTEIISVNPVGLKGMFKDVYTQNYVDEHPELLNENIEILNQSEEKELVNT